MSKNNKKTTNIQSKEEKTRKYVLIAVIVIAVLVLVGIVVHSNKNTPITETPPTEPTNDLNAMAQEIIAKDDPRIKSQLPELNNPDKKEIYEAVIDIFDRAGVGSETSFSEGKNLSMYDRLMLIDKGYLDTVEAVVPDTLELVVLQDKLNSPVGRDLSIQAILAVGYLYEDHPRKNVPDESIALITLDPIRHYAYVPLDLYSEFLSGYYFTMVYDDGVWKLDPYTIIQQIRMTDMLAARFSDPDFMEEFNNYKTEDLESGNKETPESDNK